MAIGQSTIIMTGAVVPSAVSCPDVRPMLSAAQTRSGKVNNKKIIIVFFKVEIAYQKTVERVGHARTFEVYNQVYLVTSMRYRLSMQVADGPAWFTEQRRQTCTCYRSKILNSWFT